MAKRSNKRSAPKPTQTVYHRCPRCRQYFECKHTYISPTYKCTQCPCTPPNSDNEESNSDSDDCRLHQF